MAELIRLQVSEAFEFEGASLAQVANIGLWACSLQPESLRSSPLKLSDADRSLGGYRLLIDFLEDVTNQISPFLRDGDRFTAAAHCCQTGWQVIAALQYRAARYFVSDFELFCFDPANDDQASA